MAKQKRERKPAPSGAQANDRGVSLRDRIDKDALEKLKEASRTMREAEEKRKAEEREKRIAEQKVKEKNKSFEELLAESNLDWKKFK